VNSLYQVGSAIAGSQFVLEELQKTHAFINKHRLPVPIEENDLHKQMIGLERYAGSNHFEKALVKYKGVNQLLLTLSVVVLLIVFGIAGVEYMSPELGIWKQLMDFMFKHFTLSMMIVGGIFAIVIVLAVVRGIYAKNIYGKALDKAWASIYNHVERS
jgi:hypothetical protein